MSYATITLKLYKDGIMFICKNADIEEIIPKGNGNKLVELINDVEDLCTPEAKYNKRG